MIGEDDAEHRTGEDGHHAGEARRAGRVAAEVLQRVDADQQPDPRDEGDHHEPERVEAHILAKVESHVARDPVAGVVVLLLADPDDALVSRGGHRPDQLSRLDSCRRHGDATPDTDLRTVEFKGQVG